MSNMDIYNVVRKPPAEALKPIEAGRLRGKSDINPMWRIKILTEVFGVCGIGWKYEITNQWTETGAKGEISAFCNINLYVKVDGEWSEAIPGTGGSAFVASERSGLYTSDECYKMALTDAISVACKALGVAADVYWDADRTKYTAGQSEPKQYNCCDCGKPFQAFTAKNGKEYNAGQAYHLSENMNTDGKPRCGECMKKAGTMKEKKKDVQ